MSEHLPYNGLLMNYLTDRKTSKKEEEDIAGHPPPPFGGATCEAPRDAKPSPLVETEILL